MRIFPLQRRMKDAEVGLRVAAAPCRPLPAGVVLCPIAVRQIFHVTRFATPIVDKEMFGEKAGGDHGDWVRPAPHPCAVCPGATMSLLRGARTAHAEPTRYADPARGRTVRPQRWATTRSTFHCSARRGITSVLLPYTTISWEPRSARFCSSARIDSIRETASGAAAPEHARGRRNTDRPQRAARPPPAEPPRATGRGQRRADPCRETRRAFSIIARGTAFTLGIHRPGRSPGTNV